MRLSDYFVPIIAVVKGSLASPANPPETLAAAIDSLVQQAQSRALQHDIELERFQAALFPVLAWADETISRSHQWPEEHAWQKHLLQRRYFRTGLAGREFFERLDALPENDAELREVYLMCLCLGFLGRYSLTPNSAELANIRIEQYKLLQQADPAFRAASDSALFPHAYVMAEKEGGSSRTASRPLKRPFNWRRALFYILPPLIVILVALVLHNELTSAVQHFRETADL